MAAPPDRDFSSAGAGTAAAGTGLAGFAAGARLATAAHTPAKPSLVACFALGQSHRAQVAADLLAQKQHVMRLVIQRYTTEIDFKLCGS